MSRGSVSKHYWGVILAGGEGVRLSALTRLISGEDTPKQFCPLLGGRTPLSRTKRRIARTIGSDRTIYALLKSHTRFYGKELQHVASDQLIEQPSNRGTLPAILCSLVKIVRQDEEAVVAFFPSDHHYVEEDRFMCGVELALGAAEGNPQSVILLGAVAKHAEVEYGWIEAEPSVSSQSHDGLLKIKRFWEKPSTQTARDLLERGCVWNTFVMVGRARAFLEAIRLGAPAVYQQFQRVMDQAESWDTDALSTIYDHLASIDFSKQVLSAVPERLGVWCLGDVGWSDLGDPRRVMKALDETGASYDWINRWQEGAMATGQ